ncbi:MAG: glycosyltransferase [Nanoarchaeota archaeon]|nr:glycosyltransferase [Nanoarchaeota archaeon]
MSFGNVLIYVTCFFGLFTLIYFYITLFENKSKIKSPELENYPKVTIIVPAYNEEETIALTLNSLLELDYPKHKLEILVVNDGSTDKTEVVAKTFSDKGVKVFSKKNGGKGLALNFALKHATGDFVGALDADSFVDKYALKRILGHFDNPNVMAVTPSLKVWRPKTLLQKIQMMEFLIGIFLRKVFAFLHSLHVTPGPFTIYRKSYFDETGGYDHTTITEDIEIALRIQSMNLIIENSVDAYVYTKGPPTFKALFIQRIRWYRGFLDNVVKYKYLFSKKYGLLGLFILPISFISVFMVLFSVFYVIVKYIVQLTKFMINMNNINYDWMSLFQFNFDWFNINLGPTAFLGVIAFFAGICMILSAKSMSQEKTSLKMSYIWYLIFYWVLFGSWWFAALYYKIIGKKIKWAGRWM